MLAAISIVGKPIMRKKAVILFSSGQDSTTCLAIAKAADFECYPLSFDYGQKHIAELENARRLAREMGVADHRIVTLNLGGGSALTDADKNINDYVGDHKIPSTYVPARNTIFLAIALGYAETVGAFDIFIGANAVDYSGYPDCRPDYLEAFEKVASLATKVGVETGASFKIHTPLLHLTKGGIIQEGVRLGVDFSKTISCYRADAEGRACGSCDSCKLRSKGFLEAGIPDCTVYA
jgi:7-cyano-7-deazaguanine synthase